MAPVRVFHKELHYLIINPDAAMGKHRVSVVESMTMVNP